MDLTTHPADDEYEVSIFGPGYGECIVVHLGAGEWMVVDSCLDPASGRPVALVVLEGMGVDVARQVKHVVVTHWHDDHHKGVAQVVTAAASAKVWVSAALLEDNFIDFVVALTTGPGRDTGVSEFGDIVDVLQKRRRRYPSSRGGRGRRVRYDRVAPNFCLDGMRVHKRAETSRAPAAEVHSASPAHLVLSGAMQAIAEYTPEPGKPKLRPPALTDNQVSVVLWVRLGETTILLGSDLETEKDPAMGWVAVASSNVIEGRADIYKVAHHASKSGDDVAIWGILCSDPLAICTPFSNGGVQLPTDQDLTRLKGQTNHAFCTRLPSGFPAGAMNPWELLATAQGVRSVPVNSSMEWARTRGPMRPGSTGSVPAVELSKLAFKL